MTASRSSDDAAQATGATGATDASLKILHVGDARSIHAARFIALLQELGHSARLFHPSGEFFEDQTLSGAEIYVPYFNEFYTGRNRLFVTSPIPFEVDPKSAMQGPLRWLARRMNEKRHRVYDLMRVLRSFKPDIVISTKMQDEGYLVSEAKSLMGAEFKFPWIHFVWGTDIEFFAKDEAYKITHLTRVRRVLRSCDYLFSDTERDVTQARGFWLPRRAPGGISGSWRFRH